MKYDSSQIHFPRFPSTVALSDGKTKQVWRYTFDDSLPEVCVLESAARALTNTQCTVEIFPAGPHEADVIITTMQRADGVYILYGVVIQRAVEHLLGTIATIHGQPRDEWAPFIPLKSKMFEVEWEQLGMRDPFSL